MNLGITIRSESVGGLRPYDRAIAILPLLDPAIGGRIVYRLPADCEPVRTVRDRPCELRVTVSTIDPVRAWVVATDDQSLVAYAIAPSERSSARERAMLVGIALRTVGALILHPTQWDITRFGTDFSEGE